MAISLVKQELKKLIFAKIGAKLIAYDTTCADGIVTPPPAKIFTTDKTDLEEYPAIEMLLNTASSQTNSYAKVYKNEIILGFTVVGDDEEILTRQTEAYMWALREIARDTQLDPAATTAPIDTGPEQYTPNAQRPSGLESPFVKGGWLPWLVTTVED